MAKRQRRAQGFGYPYSHNIFNETHGRLALGPVKSWDAFISHASEDKELVLSLGERLRAAGLRIWIDRQELQLGDSLSEKIDEGLAASRFGIVVFSPSFLAKRWPRQELNGLLAREESGQKVILPVWHDIDKEMLATYSPILADRVASRTESGLGAVAEDIVRVVVDPSSGSPAVAHPTLARRLISTLDRADDASALGEFLAWHPPILARALGHYGGYQELVRAVRIDQFDLHLCVKLLVGATTSSVAWVIVQLADPSHSPFDGSAEPIPSVQRQVSELEDFRRWASRDYAKVAERLPGFNQAFQCIVVAGRRAQLVGGDTERLRDYNAELVGVTLRTYDWLIDAAVTLS